MKLQLNLLFILLAIYFLIKYTFLLDPKSFDGFNF